MVTSPQSHKAGWHDSFNAYMLRGARYDGPLEIPWINTSDSLPTRLITYSKAKYTDDYDQWVCFYEYDYKFLRDVWQYPEKALEVIQKFQGAIAPDFSLYRDMPLALQHQSIFRSHVVAHYWNQHGIPVIPNIRWGDKRTYAVSCDGVSRCNTIAIGSHGCLKDRTNRHYFTDGLSYVLENLQPTNLIVYGPTPNDVFSQYTNQTHILQFSSEIAQVHEKGE